jgi:Flp pilus assembly protein TadD
MEEAVGAANEAVERSAADDRLVYRCERAKILAQAGRTGQAVAECQAMLKEYTQDKEVLEIRYHLSGVYTYAKDHDRAAEQLQLILQKDPNHATANNDLGYIWADQGKKLEEAERLIRKALELDRKERNSSKEVGTDGDLETAAYVDSLGWVLFRRGRLQEARQELEKAARLPNGDDDPVVWDHLGDVYARLEEPDRARACWQKAVALYEGGGLRSPDDRYKEIKQKLKLLERE